MGDQTNPFPASDADRHALWQILVERDIDAFVAQDWSMVADDFLEDAFTAVDARGSDNPDDWRLTFPSVAEYRDAWLRDANAMAPRVDPVTLRRALLDATTMRDIEISGDAAMLHKKFDGYVETRDGERIRLNWQTIYQCKKVNGVWKIAGFVGYLPYPMGSAASKAER